MQRNCTNCCSLLHKDGERSQSLCKKSTIIGADLLHFSCCSGPETHKKGKELAPIIELFYKNIGNVPNRYVTSTLTSAISLQFSCVSGPEMQKNCNKIAPFIYLNVSNLYVTNKKRICCTFGAFVPNLYVTKYKDWCNFVAFFVVFRPRNAQN